MGQGQLNDKPRNGRDVTANDWLHQDRDEELIRGTHRIQQKETAVTLGISMGRVEHNIGKRVAFV